MKFHWIKRWGVVSSFALFSSIFSVSVSAQEMDGQKLFKANCASCHKPDKPSTGPALQGARQRWADAGEAEEIYEWVKDPVGLVNSGKSTRAKEIESFSPTAMTPQGHLSREQVDAIFDYVDSYTPPAPPTGGAEVASNGGTSGSNTTLWVVLLAVVLLVIIFLAAGVRRQLAHVANQKEGVDEDIAKSYKQRLGEWIVRNWQLTLILFLSIWGIKSWII